MTVRWVIVALALKTGGGRKKKDKRHDRTRKGGEDKGCANSVCYEGKDSKALSPIRDKNIESKKKKEPWVLVNTIASDPDPSQSS